MIRWFKEAIGIPYAVWGWYCFTKAQEYMESIEQTIYEWLNCDESEAE